jgi:hypothetical protein
MIRDPTEYVFPSTYLKTETGPVSGTLSFLIIYNSFLTIDIVHKPSDSELYTPSSQPFKFQCLIKSRRMRLAGHAALTGEKRNAYRLLVGKPEGKRPLGRPRRSWVDNIRMYLGEVGWGDVEWIGLAKDRNWWRAVVNSVLNLRVP